MIDWDGIKCKAKEIGECWNMVDEGAFASAAFQQKVIDLAKLCGLTVMAGKKVL